MRGYPDRLSAELDQGLLESAGIAAFVSADDAGGVRPPPFQFTFGAQLVVRESDTDRAREVLGEYAGPDSTEAAPSPAPSKGKSMPLAVFLALCLGPLGLFYVSSRTAMAMLLIWLTVLLASQANPSLQSFFLVGNLGCVVVAWNTLRRR